MRGYGLLQSLKQHPWRLPHNRQASFEIPTSASFNVRRKRGFADILSDHLSSPSPREISSTESSNVSLSDSSSSSKKFVTVNNERVSDAVDITAYAIASAKSVKVRKKDHGKLDSVVSDHSRKRISSSLSKESVSKEANSNGCEASSVTARKNKGDDEEDALSSVYLNKDLLLSQSEVRVKLTGDDDALIKDGKDVTSELRLRGRYQTSFANQHDEEKDFQRSEMEVKPTNGGDLKDDTDPDLRLRGRFKNSHANKRENGQALPLGDKSQNLGKNGNFDPAEATSVINAQNISPAEDRDPASENIQTDAKTACINREPFKTETVDESKKNMYQIAFPVSVFIEWWITCFTNTTGHVTDIAFPLGKIHVWVSAYQRIHMEMTGRHADGQTIAALIRKLHVLQAVVIRGSFRWSDTKHIHLHSPLEDEEGHSKSPAFQDDLVQEVLLLILEPIFEARFSVRSHAYRPGRDVHSALKYVKTSFPKCTWFISGNVSILEEEVYITRIVECVVRVVRDPRVSSLLKGVFLGSERPAKLGQDGKDKSRIISTWGSCSRLKNFLCNVYLDRLDKWMDDQILTDQSRVSSAIERPSKLEYVRYGTEFLVGCKGPREEAQNIMRNLCVFFKQTYRMDYSREWTINHISDGIEFLDHVISRKVVHPLISRRNMISNDRVSEKRYLGLGLSLKASRERCRMHLKDMTPPTSIEQIRDILSILYNWYHIADDREKTIEYCKYYLCSAYVMNASPSSEKQQEAYYYLKQLREVMKMLREDCFLSDVSERSCVHRVWIPEHEKSLKNLAWLRDEKIMDQVRLRFQLSEKVSPQQHMGQVVWQFLQGSYPMKGDYYSLEPEIGIQNSLDDTVNCRTEELSESMA